MKKTILILAALSSSFMAFADTYQAPKIEFANSKTDDVKAVAPSSEAWRSNYKVQQTPAPERNVASDEHWVDESEKAQKAPARDPSSVKPESSIHPHVKPWFWSVK